MEQIDHLNMTTKFACHKIAFATFAIACLSAQPAVADRISAGPSNTCFITAGRTLRCWGSNEGGQIGDGTINQRLLPVDVLNEVIAVTSGIQHTCAATSDGAMYCWGNNLSGQVGNGFGGGDPFTSRVMQPTGVVGLTYGVAAISAGNSHSCAVTATGQAKCWGLNGNGQLGDFTTAMRLSPVDVVGMTSGVHAIAAGGYHTCALTPSKGVQCWGLNANGQLGTGTTNEALTPVNVIGMASGLTAVSAGQWHTCALTASGGVKCWGFNGNGQLGDGSIEQRLAPIDVIGLSAGVSAISAGTYHTCALTSDGVVKCWGFNAAGQLGDGSTAQSLVPVAVVGIGGGASAVTVGKYHTCAIASDGSARCWGDNGVGQLGDGTTIQRLTPASAVSAAVPIVEFYNPQFDHYFITWIADEIAKLDADTVIKGWQRTGQSFKVLPNAGGGTSGVCRIYIPPSKGDGHFFGRDAGECDGTLGKNPTFILESPSFFYLTKPTLGTCAEGMTPVYRVFSNRPDANHRYTTDRATREQMVAKGWVAEGDGPDTVVMCAPLT